MWKTIRQALPKNTNPCRQHTKETNVLADQFSHFFVAVSAKAARAASELAQVHGFNTAQTIVTSPPCSIPDGNLFDFQLLSCADVGKAIRAMPSNKAPGHDKITISVIKDCLPHILNSITFIINLSLASSTFPRAWKKAEVITHLKDGDHEDPNNNRPISLLPVLSKVAVKLALEQFNTFLQKNMLISNHQSGNKKHHSTETLSLRVTNHLFKAIDEGKVTAMVFIDLSKAFDSICHETLLSKLKSLCCSPRALAWFRSYLTNRQQTTRIGTSVSSPLNVTHGVPQGSILGPILFSLYMNDLPKAISNCKIESYVDDQQDLNRFAEWCCANHLLINPTKTKSMLFGTRQNLSRFNGFSVTFLEKVLTPVRCCKDLGITLDCYLSFDDHITSLSSSLLGKIVSN